MNSDQKPRVYRRLESTQSVKNAQAMYYLQSKNPYLYDEGSKIAWITSGGPVEFLVAMNIVPLYPEQYGAIAGSAKDSTRLSQVAESHGYSQDICAYARTSFGSILSPESPTPLSEIDGVGGLSKPDMLICGNNICGTVLKWYQDLARIYTVPLFIFDTPPLTSNNISSYYLEYLTTQMQEYISFLEHQMNKKMDFEGLSEVFQNSKRSIELWTKILSLGEAIPAPLNCADRFLLMAPVVSQRGTMETVSLYEEVYQEVQTRVDDGEGAITIPERFRLLWDNIPIWFNLYDFYNTLAQKGVVFPVDTYTNAWSQNFQETGDLLKDAAVMYSNIYLNKTLQHKIDLIGDLAKRYQCDGILYHSMRSCKRYSLGQPITRGEVTEKTNIPGTLIEGDMNDSRAYSEGQVMTRIDALLELIESQRN
ncbi:MAG: 2-hydroxyacyl-CoA dehydratase subunit D [Candidatus Hodarchaeales archaeon]|jgi:benzoyl-CoA reductase/2-hydroxyglutaryl-CoA dehydratase subunit BcrC/BadD/HgdB